MKKIFLVALLLAPLSSQAAPPVVWAASAGSITQTGAFTAPPCSTALPQTVTITATSGVASATSTVTVTDAVTGIVVTPATSSVAPLGTVQFTATVKTICNPTGTASVLPVPASALRAQGRPSGGR